MASEIEVHVKGCDVWLTFTASTGRSASLSIASLANQKSGIVGMALREWAADQIEDSKRSKPPQMMHWLSEDPEYGPYFDLESACDALLGENDMTRGTFQLDRARHIAPIWVAAHVNSKGCWDYSEHRTEADALEALSKAEGK